MTGIFRQAANFVDTNFTNWLEFEIKNGLCNPRQ